ncbi:hypothetical protein B0T26DRAFT_748372 [Lasiosphaeria miniovina]|uniref:Uncharacterized protein n=1 Tax=Lasiosphaeria miniovina TaxID=1954250 RepID=A0AA40B5P4_9PEZI|nr:uncharacterized protein B0T26DRAFT_748372 [Lasiosphaeria miniovina]KAK0728098.1 hypothetical protein B0T26DRAFT_748372 [Lasiosphaeria miniovina]
MVGPPPTNAGFTVNTMFDDFSRQLAAVSSRRHSRGSASGSQRAGHPMRITKPGSANNSPHSAILQSRRKTFIGEGLQGRLPPQHAFDMHYLPTPTSETQNGPLFEQERKQARPVSWHPSSQYPPRQPPQQQQQQQQHQQLYPIQTNMYYPYQHYGDGETISNVQQLPPTPMPYSGYTSPSLNFSPLSLPYSSFGSQQVCSPINRAFPIQQAPTFPPAYVSSRESEGAMSETACRPGPRVVDGTLDWESFAARGGFDRDTAPPTPEDFVQAQKVETKLATEDSIPYQPLEDDESEGEILYGMGLYDAPDKTATNPILDLHRSTIFSLLGGAGSYPEPTGKGLKLEDAWEPPASDDEDVESEDDADDDEQDE